MGNIIKYMITQSSPIVLRPGQTITGSVDDEYYCYFIESGLAVQYIKESKKPLTVVTGTQLVGLSHLIFPRGDFKLKIIHTCVVYALPASKLLAIINESDLWPEVAHALAQDFYELSHSAQRTENSKVKDLIPQTLHMLQSESEEVRLTHAVNDYVCHITGLSQSTVKRSLNTLKEQGHIEVQNGLLLRCNVK